MEKGVLERLDDYSFLLPKGFVPCMRVPGVIFATEKLLEHIIKDEAFRQVANAACLPGIVKYSLAMPDIHWGYGLPIGGVVAESVEEGVISPGGVGSDINCGVRLIETNLTKDDIEGKIERLVNLMYTNVPCGVGSEGKLHLSQKELGEVLVDGSQWAVRNGFGWKEDTIFTEEKGKMDFANPENLSKRAFERGLPQLGTLGAGNHFLEIQTVERIFDERTAKILGLFEGQVTVMVHTGSRGLGFQVCEDYMKEFIPAMARYGINLPDRQLACAPISSPEGKRYLGAMASAANYAWANRQMITHWVRESFEKALETPAERLGMHILYDVAHNIAKFETHTIDGKKMKLLIHRKGATRAFGPGSKEIPEKFQKAGQPVIIPGDMGTASYILVGTETAMQRSFGSTCHGAGRVMSRHAAIRKTKGKDIVSEMGKRGIYVRAKSRRTLAEEVPEAYKDIDEIVEAVCGANLSKKVARLVPLGVVKG